MEIEEKRQRASQALQAGDLATAERLLREVCGAAPGDVQAWLLLASVRGRRGDYPGVLAACERVLERVPGSPQALSFMAGAHAAMGHADEAEAGYRRVVRLTPRDPVVRYNFGAALFVAGKGAEAVAQLQEAVRLQPRYVEAHCALASAHEALGQYQEAKVHYREAIRLRPELEEAYARLADLLNATGMIEEGERYYREGLRHHPRSLVLHLGLANSLRYQGRFDDALAVYARALRQWPGEPEVVAGEADLYERKGEWDAAHERLRGLVARGALTANGADVYLRLCHRYGECDEAISLAEGLIEGGKLNGGQLRTLHQRLGKLHDRLGAFDEAFGHFDRANRLLNVRFDAEELRGRVDGLIAGFSAEALASMARAEVETERPIFIVGMPRSGTSLVEQILASHPRVYGAGELTEITALVRSLPVTLYPHAMAGVEAARLEVLARRYLETLGRLDAEAARVTDKMPGNFFHLGFIALLFPHARVIHCMRDPLDNGLSIFCQSFNLSHTYATDLRAIGIYYREYRRLMAHWHGVLELPILDVQYEDLVADPEGVSREIVAFAGLDWDERCLRFHESGRAVATASFDQVRKPIYKGSVGRWRRYERHLGPLLEVLNHG